MADLSVERLTHAGTFAAGFALLIASLNLFDRALPDLGEAEEEREALGRRLWRRWIMFAAGAGLTLVSLSVTLSLSILVPLTQHRIVKLKYLVPYILGANVTTLVDTLFAAVVMDAPQASTIVLAGFASITVISLTLLAGVYRRYETLMLGFTEWAIASGRNLTISVGLFLVVPVALLVS